MIDQIHRLLVLCLLTLTTSIAAQPGEFVRGRVIQAAEEQSVLRVVVPQDVYEWVTRWDLGDVRVLTSDGVEVPYRLRRPQSRREFSDWVELPVFALPAPDSESGDASRVDIQLDDGGAVVAVKGAVSGMRKPGAHLLDASGYDVAFSEVRVGWQVGSEGFVGKFRLEASNDLNSWGSVVNSATLADLRTGAGEVVVDRIEVKPTKARYLRLTQLEGNEPLQMDALAVRSRQTQLPPRNWKALVGEPVDEGFEFYIGGLFPLDRVAVDVDSESYLIVASLFSRSRPKDPWRARGRHTFYKAMVGDVVATSRSVASRSQDQYWRVQLESGDVDSPTLRVGWRPDEIVFLNQSPGPLLLAYGRGGLEGKQWPMRELLARIPGDEDLQQVMEVSLSAPTTLGGPAMRQPPPAPVDWQTVLLWSALVLGVGVVGGLAYRLVKATG